jgi:hypothetical protein
VHVLSKSPPCNRYLDKDLAMHPEDRPLGTVRRFCTTFEDGI